jgi:NitT/TauT family transport system permease protein
MPAAETPPTRGATGAAGDWRASAVSMGVLLVLWEVAGRTLDSAVLPPFSAVLAALGTLAAQGRIFGNLGLSLVSLAVGFALAVAVGVTIGALMGRYRLLGEVLDPYLWIGVSAPGLLYVPILFTLFGTSRLTQVAAVFTHAVWIVIATTETGVRRTSPALERMAAAFGASERDLFWKVRLPEARPHIAAGLRIGVLYAVKGMINGEMFLALVGLGALVRTYGGRFEAANVLAVVLVIVSVALAAAAAVGALTRRDEAVP